MELTSNQTVGELARVAPASLRVFSRRGIDFCCGGRLPLENACAKAGLEVEAVLEEIRAEQQRAEPSDVRWDARPTGELIAHLLEHYHQPLESELPRLEAMARKVLRVHGPKDPERLASLLGLVLEVRAELEAHMRKEEDVLFPWIVAGGRSDVSQPIQAMLQEHDTAADLLTRLREVTDDYSVPQQACATWRALWQGLEQFDRELREHIHLENNILFPRAVEALG